MVQSAVYRLQNVRSGTYLDASLKNRGVVHGWESRPENKNQQWHVQHQGGDKYVIQNVGTGDYIHVWKTEDSIDVKATDDATPVRLEQHGDAYAIYLKDSDRVVDLDMGKSKNGTGVNAWKFTGAEQQLWRFEGSGQGEDWPSHSSGQPRGEPSNRPPPPPQSNYRGAVNPGTYYIRNVHTGTALDLAGGASADGTKVIGYSAGSGNNQKWVLESGSRGYRLKNGQSGTYASHQRHETAADGVLLTGNNNPIEWDVRQADQGYQIFLAGTNFVLDLASGDASDGAKICLWSNNNGNNQKWNFQQA